MKILIAFGKDTYPNPYVRTLAESLCSLGLDVTCSINEFWNNWDKYDVIHLQWPQMLVQNLNTIEELKEHFRKIKNTGIPIVITCHNFCPHYYSDLMEKDAYEVSYEYSDCVIHLASYSYGEFINKYPDKKHVIIPHHIYDKQYRDLPSREEAIKHFGLNSGIRYILCFGAFRNQKERDIANIVANYYLRKRIEILAPGFYRFEYQGNLWKTIKKYIHYIATKLKYRNIHFSSRFVSEEELPYYYAACDIALIQRIRILNSGNLPMAYMMGKVVIGPDVGNVGVVLHETGNPTFNVNDLSTLFKAVNEALDLCDRGKGDENKEYAFANFSSDIIANQHLRLYCDLLHTVQNASV